VASGDSRAALHSAIRPRSVAPGWQRRQRPMPHLQPDDAAQARRNTHPPQDRREALRRLRRSPGRTPADCKLAASPPRPYPAWTAPRPPNLARRPRHPLRPPIRANGSRGARHARRLQPHHPRNAHGAEGWSGAPLASFDLREIADLEPVSVHDAGSHLELRDCLLLAGRSQRSRSYEITCMVNKTISFGYKTDNRSPKFRGD